jgi:hypothetical protein
MLRRDSPLGSMTVVALAAAVLSLSVVSGAKAATVIKKHHAYMPHRHLYNKAPNRMYNKAPNAQEPGMGKPATQKPATQ